MEGPARDGVGCEGDGIGVDSGTIGKGGGGGRYGLFSIICTTGAKSACEDMTGETIRGGGSRRSEVGVGILSGTNRELNVCDEDAPL